MYDNVEPRGWCVVELRLEIIYSLSSFHFDEFKSSCVGDYKKDILIRTRAFYSLSKTVTIFLTVFGIFLMEIIIFSPANLSKGR